MTQDRYCPIFNAKQYLNQWGKKTGETTQVCPRFRSSKKDVSVARMPRRKFIGQQCALMNFDGRSADTVRRIACPQGLNRLSWCSLPSFLPGGCGK